MAEFKIEQLTSPFTKTWDKITKKPPKVEEVVEEVKEVKKTCMSCMDKCMPKK